VSKNQKKVYAPDLRNYLEDDETAIKGYSQKDHDSIVSSNTADQEFNYTYDEEDDIGYDNDYFDEE
jgi:hypothetical protein